MNVDQYRSMYLNVGRCGWIWMNLRMNLRADVSGCGGV